MIDPTTPLLDWLIAALLLLGSMFALIGSIGLARFSDFYRRLHGPTKATTLGVGGVLLASALFFSRLEGSVSLRELLVVVFLFVTAPVSCQLLVKAALAHDPDAPAPAPPGSDGTAHAGTSARADAGDADTSRKT